MGASKLRATSPAKPQVLVASCMLLPVSLQVMDLASLYGLSTDYMYSTEYGVVGVK